MRGVPRAAGDFQRAVRVDRASSRVAERLTIFAVPRGVELQPTTMRNGRAAGWSACRRGGGADQREGRQVELDRARRRARRS